MTSNYWQDWSFSSTAQHHTTVDCSEEKMENIDKVKLSKNEARIEQMIRDTRNVYEVYGEDGWQHGCDH